MMISPISSSMVYQTSPLVSNLRASGLTAEKAILAAADVKGAIEKVGMVQRGPANKAAITAALQERISADVAAGKLTADDAAAVVKTFEAMDPAKRREQKGPGAGLTKEQIDAELARIGAADSQRTAMLSKLSENFSAADANGDGKLSREEAQAYLQQGGEGAGPQHAEGQGRRGRGAGGPPPGGGAGGAGGQSSQTKTVLSESSVVIGALKTTTTIYTDGTSETKTQAVSADVTSKAYDNGAAKAYGAQAGDAGAGAMKPQAYLSSLKPGSLFDFLVQ